LTPEKQAELLKLHAKISELEDESLNYPHLTMGEFIKTHHPALYPLRQRQMELLLEKGTP
jgi:hypothetical protein